MNLGGGGGGGGGGEVQKQNYCTLSPNFLIIRDPPSRTCRFRIISFFRKIYSGDIKYFIDNYHIWYKLCITFVVDIAFGLIFLQF